MNKSDSHKGITGYFLLPEISNGLLRVPGSSVRSGTRMILLSDAESETPSTQASGDVDALGLGRADRRLDGRGAGGLGGLSGIGLGLGALGAELGRSTSNLLPAASGSNQAARVGERLVGGHLEILKILSGGERGDGRPLVDRRCNRGDKRGVGRAIAFCFTDAPVGFDSERARCVP